MNNINKIYLFLAGGLLLVSCETLDLDKTENPNFLTEEQQAPDLLLNSIQLNFVRQIEGNADFDTNENFQSGGATNGDGLSQFGKELTRLVTLTSSKQYNSVYQGSDSDDEWINAYVGVISNIRALAPLAEESGLTRHLGISQFIEAYVITAMVDFYGDVPYSQAVLGLENLNPETDSGAEIYQSALGLLDSAITNFTNDATSVPDYDPFYGNDYDLWVKAANTLKIKLYNQMRLADGSAADSIQDIIDVGDYIQQESENFEFNWPATSASLPDTRHPRFGLNYTPTGAEDYMSNWLMSLMDTSNDPRIRYYFYRQSDCTPGSSCLPDGDEETLNCSLQNPPQHYVDGGFTFCYLDNGYWGRDHMDDGGIPPDGFLRTTYGVYPVGGNFDDNRYEGISTTSASGGAGTSPILTASWIDFTKAELALANNDTPNAKIHLMAAISKHIAEVQTYIEKDPLADSDFEPTAAEITSYVETVTTNFESATSNDERWDILGEQFLIATFANGIEAYNFYRRTGAPSTLQPGLDPSPGGFIRSLFYPADAVNTNSNISQKPDVGQAVFWDTNASAPSAN